ncbi:MAG: thioredoxin family protein [Leucothrix sp.]
MKRRTFISLIAGLALAPSLVTAASVEYTPGLIKQALAEGKTVFVDYAASWCSTCKRQERLINQLRERNPVYDKHLTFVRVDWDVYGDHEVTESRNIPRRSTLIVLNGEKELGRIVAGTNINKIQELMDMGVAKAQAK